MGANTGVAGGVTVKGSGWEQGWRSCSSERLHEVGPGWGRCLGACHSGGSGARGSGWCHAGVAAVGVSLGWPRGPCCPEGCPATLPCPAAGREGGGSRAEGSCFRHVSFLGKTMQGRDHHPGGVSRGGLRGAPGTSAYPLHALQHQGLSGPHLLLPQSAPGMPIPLHAVCLKLG